MAQAQYAGTGRRKNAVARVRLVPGTGKITVNKKDVEEYIPHADLRLVINQPFAVTSTEGSYDPSRYRSCTSSSRSRLPRFIETRWTSYS